MAWTEFYIQPGGDNTNSGTTVTSTATIATSNGSWDTTTNRFTAASGTPFLSATIGDWAAIMADGAIGFTSLSQITAVDPSGTYIDVTATGRIGVIPATSASGRTCKMGGAWADFAIATPGSQWGASGTAAVPMRINVKAATYANASTARTFATAGSGTAPIWIRGYNTTPGDLENDYTNAPPLLTFAAAGFTISGTCYCVTNFSVLNTGSSSAIWNWSGTNGRADRIRAEAQNSPSGVQAFTSGTNGAGMLVTNSWFKVPTTASQVYTATSTVQMHGCVFEGGQNAVTTSSAGTTLNHCVFIGQTTRAINAATATILLMNCSFVGSFSDSIVRWSSSPGVLSSITNCVFSGAGKYDIEAVSGFTHLIHAANNASYGAALGHLSHPDLADLHYALETADPFVNGATDPTLKKTTFSYQKGIGSAFENETWRSYRSVGAIEPQPTSGGSSGGPARVLAPNTWQFVG
ncbi:unnamed protein product [Gemmata massiliana]|uniref:Uncharacterized protein n=1 Tax=Gemmata massiliana TaxID=1210884 RepID=A0A6P2CVM6_9BACT|nr:hypothetical protein [Gemmata massiliana]VTR93198.1 unnamed protein product [Gemmata massiliana]